MNVAQLDAAANAAIDSGNQREALRNLIAANRLDPDAGREVRIRDMRLTEDLYGERKQPTFDDPPITLSYQQGIPSCALEDVTPAILRAAFKERGCLYVPKAVNSAEVEQMSSAIEAAQNACRDEEPEAQWHNHPKMGTRDEAMKMASVRSWSQDVGGCLAADSPRAMYQVCDMLERHGIMSLAEDYLGEPPVFSASKFMLWRVPGEGPTAGWHQDGRFLGDEIASLNVWTALTDCGVDAPGMDLVLEYFDHYIMPSKDSHFDWTVSDAQVDEMRETIPVVTPKFEAGDMLMFDNWLLHRTNRVPGMTKTRYAIESWFFAPSVFPDGRVALLA